MAEIKIELRHAVKVLRGVVDDAVGDGAVGRAAREVANEARNNAFKRPGRSFWRSVGLSIETVDGGGARGGHVVGVKHVAAAQKQFGGVIEAPGKGPGATGAKALTIPIGKAREERWNVDKASGHYRLFLVKGKAGRGFLFGTPRHGSAKHKREKTQPLFLLRKRVSQRAEPWFPEGAQLEAAISRGLSDYWQRSGGGGSDGAE